MGGVKVRDRGMAGVIAAFMLFGVLYLGWATLPSRRQPPPPKGGGVPIPKAEDTEEVVYTVSDGEKTYAVQKRTNAKQGNEWYVVGIMKENTFTTINVSTDYGYLSFNTYDEAVAWIDEQINPPMDAPQTGASVRGSQSWIDATNQTVTSEDRLGNFSAGTATQGENPWPQQTMGSFSG